MSERNTKSSDRADWNDWKKLGEFRPEWATEGIERINAELEKWSDRIQTRSHQFRKQSQKRIEKGVAQIQTELRKLPAIQRAEELRQELETRVQTGVEAGLDQVYTRLNLARLEEVKKLEKKIAALNKKLRALEDQPSA